jgi:hypothetical protein
MAQQDLKLFLRDSLLRLLYNSSQKHYKKELTKLIRKNNELHKVTHGFARYRGRIYKPWPASVTYAKSYPLFSNLEAKFEENVNNLAKIEEESSTVDRLLTLLFNKLNHADDLQQILGTSLYNSLVQQTNNATQFFQGKRVSSKKLQQIAVKYQPQLDIVKQRLVANMLLRSSYDESKN